MEFTNETYKHTMRQLLLKYIYQICYTKRLTYKYLTLCERQIVLVEQDRDSWNDEEKRNLNIVFT